MANKTIKRAPVGRPPKLEEDKKMLKSFFSEVRKKAQKPGGTMTDAELEVILGITNRSPSAKGAGGRVLRDLAVGRRHDLSKAKFVHAAKVAADRRWCSLFMPLVVIREYGERDPLRRSGELQYDDSLPEAFTDREMALVFKHLQSAMRTLAAVARRTGAGHRAYAYLLESDFPDDRKLATSLVQKSVASIAELFNRVKY